MALIKNEIPILEYDTEKKAIIMPGHGWDYKFTKKAVMLFMEEEIDNYVSSHDCEVVGEFESITKKFPVYKIVHNGEKIVFCQAPLGGAAATHIMDQLIGGGAREIIATGCCGSLIDDTEGDFFIPTAALRQEGASYHYLPPAREVEMNDRAIQAIVTALENNNLNYRKCKTWTTDGFYRETREMVLYRKEEGCSVVEMECASLAAYVEFLKLLDDKYPKEDKIRIVLDNLKVHTSEATRKYLVTVPERFEFVFTPKHGSWLNMVEGFFSKTTRQMLRGIRVKFKEELTNRIYRYFAEINEEPIVFHGNIISMILMYRKKSLLIHCLSKSRVN